MDELENQQPEEHPTRREREKAAHRRDILTAAENVFAEKGFERSTMEDVARAAEFSVGALYNYFENKELLWSEVITRITRDFLDAFLKETRMATNPLEAIRILIRMKLGHAQAHGAFLRVFMGTILINKAISPGISAKQCCCLYEEYLKESAALFRNAMDKGVLRQTDATYTALMLEGMVQSFRAHWARHEMDLSLTEQAQLIEQHFLNPLMI